jgi:hypothetical protein
VGYAALCDRAMMRIANAPPRVTSARGCHNLPAVGTLGGRFSPEFRLWVRNSDGAPYFGIYRSEGPVLLQVLALKCLSVYHLTIRPLNFLYWAAAR